LAGHKTFYKEVIVILIFIDRNITMFIDKILWKLKLLRKLQS